MAVTPLNNNPEETRNRADQPVSNLRFPLHEDMPMATRLQFTRYSRFQPSSEPTEDTTAVISLPLPLSIPDHSSIRSGSVDLDSWGMINPEILNKAYSGGISGTLSMMADAAKAGYGVITNAVKSWDESLKVSGLKAIALSPFFSDQNQARIGVFAGVVRNPHTNLVFDGVNLKSYTFTWRLSPRSQQESDALRDIVNTFKMRSHPEEVFSGYALDYPDLVYVTFTGDAQRYLPVIHKSIITNLTINYGQGAGIGFFKSGAPVETEISMSIAEVNIITRQILEEDEAIQG